MINVGFDSQIFMLQKFGGIRNYFVNLLKLFSNHKSYGINPIIYSFGDVFIRNSTELDFINREFKANTFKEFLRPLSPKFNDPKIEIFHSTYYIPFLNNFFWYVPHVMTIHDMIPELFPSPHSKYNAHFAKKTYFDSASGIIAVSDSTKKDIEKIYGITNKQLTKIYHGVDHEAFFPPKNYSPEKFFIYVGKRSNYKNGILAISAMENLPSDIKLLFIGGGKFTKQEASLIKTKKLENRIFQKDATINQLASLYRSAIGLLVTSQYEGFGLPILESMASGCPVVIGKTAPAIEICGNSAMYFEPNSIESLSSTLDLLIRDRAIGNSMSMDGIALASNFTWERCAQETADLYFRLISKAK